MGLSYVVSIGWREDEKAEAGWTNFGETIEKRSTRRLWWGKGMVRYVGFGTAIVKWNT